MTRFLLPVAATVLTLASFAHAGPVGRDMDRNSEPTRYASEQPVNPADVSFEVVRAPRFDRESPPSSCYQLVAVDKAGTRKIVEPCLSGNQDEINKATAHHTQTLREAYAEGRRIVFVPTQDEVDRADKAFNKEDRR